MAIAGNRSDKNLPKDIRVGIVLHLDPDTLEKEDATYTCDEAAKVQGQHFFLCVKTGGSETEWLPLYTNPGPGRVELASEGRKGHSKWLDGHFHYHPAQIWKATRKAVVAA